MNRLKKSFFLAFFAFAVSAFPAKAGDLVGFSRACNMENLNGYTLWVALRFFSYIGMPETYLDIYKKSNVERRNYWVVESFTGELPQLRGDSLPKYYLFAESWVYRSANEAVLGGSRSEYRRVATYKSRFAAQKVDSEIFTDSTLSIIRSRHLSEYMNGFGATQFARAGQPEIMRYDSDPSAQYLVYGQHWYLDPSTGVSGTLNISRATDCNLANSASGRFDWGLP